MTALLLLQLAMVAGASCFFAAGWLIGRRAVAQLQAKTEALKADHARMSRLVSELGEARSFDGIVRGVAARDGVRCVAIADEQSLTIAGWGENQEGLAALSGALLESAARVQSLLPIGKISRITLETEAGTAVGSFPLVMGGVEMVLATLSNGPAPASGELRRVFEEVARHRPGARA